MTLDIRDIHYGNLPASTGLLIYTWAGALGYGIFDRGFKVLGGGGEYMGLELQDWRAHFFKSGVFKYHLLDVEGL